MIRIPVATGSSSEATGRCAMWLPSRIHTRWDTSSALDRSPMSSFGMPSRWVTIRVMSMAAFPTPSIALITWSTEAIDSASDGRRTAMRHTALMS